MEDGVRWGCTILDTVVGLVEGWELWNKAIHALINRECGEAEGRWMGGKGEWRGAPEGLGERRSQLHVFFFLN